jgi:HD-GYP domain-containing protein (c-di-GMP phosphodiesterase class II)
MRVIVASSDEEAAGWLQNVLTSAGLSVAVLGEPVPSAPELSGGDLLVADRLSADSIGDSGPRRRMLLVPRGHVVDVAAALSGGFLDLIIIPSPEDEILARVGRALDRFLKPMKTASAAAGSQAAELKAIVERVVTTLKKSGPDRAQKTHELAEGMLSVFVLMIDAHETSDRGTPGHSKRAASILGAIAKRLEHNEEQVGWLELAGRLHDIGLVPLQVPMKDAAPLSLELRRALSEHPKLGADILKPLAVYGLPVDAIRWHHERLDGTGYPDGLIGDQIPLDAQIVGVADAFEALTSPRPWRGAETKEAALSALRTGHGFLPDVLDALESSLADEDLPPVGLPSL